MPGLTISKVYGNTMLVILNNRIANNRLRDDSLDNLDGAPRSPGDRTRNPCIFTVPSARHASSGGGSAIIVTKDRLIFRLDSDIQRLPPKSDLETRSFGQESIQSNPIYVSPTFLPCSCHETDELFIIGTCFRLRN